MFSGNSDSKLRPVVVGEDFVSVSDVNDASTNYVGLYINFMLEKYGCCVKSAAKENQIYQDQNLTVRSTESEYESPLSPFVEESQLHEMDFNCGTVFTIEHESKKDPLQQQAQTTVTTKKTTTNILSSNFVLHTPHEMEKKMEEKAQLAGKRGRGRPRKTVVNNDKKTSKKNKSN
ncbi:hypothetical protein ABK040_014778 [Willaertia magna]